MVGLTHEVCVLLTPRATGGHEAALVGWLCDAVRQTGLRPLVVAPDPALAALCADAGLAGCLDTHAGTGQAAVLRALRRWPVGRPLLLAPGVLHAQAWLLVTALALGHQVWVYVPMAFKAQHMRYRWGRARDRLLAPWLRRVAGWITLDDRQAALLRQGWGVVAPVHLLPNRARLATPAATPPAPLGDGRLRVAWVGRFDLHQKGLDWLAGTIERSPNWTACFSWRFQGRGEGEAALRALAGRLAPGAVSVCAHAPIRDALAASDVLLLASRYEGLPLVALEATASGWPVVATRESGLQELLDAEAQFAFGDAMAMRQALERLREPQRRAQAVARARARLERLCDGAHYEQRLRGVVHALKGARPGAAP